MVALAVTIASKRGQVILSRQFIGMTKSRLESLINIFPRLITKSSSSASIQHTYIETDDVRYLYHPMEHFYLILLTTKSSNIIDDLETLKLFARIFPEYCKSLTEKDVCDAAFDLLFAFDEVISLGYKEDLTPLQIKTFTDMDSHDERVFLAMRQSQERDAKEKMKEKAKELEMQRKLQMTTGIKPISFGVTESIIIDTKQPEILLSSKSSSSIRRSPSPPAVEKGRTLKLSRAKGMPRQPKNLTEFKEEVTIPKPKRLPIHFRCEEKISIVISHERGLKSMEISGLLYINLSDENITKVKVRIDHEDTTPIQIQTHPHLDKVLFQSENILAMKQIEKSFPLNNDVYLLKWNLISINESDLPLTVTCWPNKTSKGVEMTIEYQLQNQDITLTDFWMSLPISTSGQYEITQYEEGEYSLERRSPAGSIGRFIVWKVPVIDATTSQGMLEYFVENFSTKECLPISAGFACSKSLCGIKIAEIINLEDLVTQPEFSCDNKVTCEKFQIE